MKKLQETNSVSKESQSMSGKRTTGVDCPVCKYFIPVSIHQLLSESSVSCPLCGLSLTIDRTQSKQALDALQKVQDAVATYGKQRSSDDKQGKHSANYRY